MEGLRDHDYLQHMLDAISRIAEYTDNTNKQAFLANGMMQDAVIRNIEIIGEAANRLSPEFANHHHAIPWRDIAGMRHRLVHGYFKVNLNTVWNVAAKDLPELEAQIRALLSY
jgi:uncharacterized protein with HEPN domain